MHNSKNIKQVKPWLSRYTFKLTRCRKNHRKRSDHISVVLMHLDLSGTQLLPEFGTMLCLICFCRTSCTVYLKMTMRNWRFFSSFRFEFLVLTGKQFGQCRENKIILLGLLSVPWDHGQWWKPEYIHAFIHCSHIYLCVKVQIFIALRHLVLKMFWNFLGSPVNTRKKGNSTFYNSDKLGKIQLLLKELLCLK